MSESHVTTAGGGLPGIDPNRLRNHFIGHEGSTKRWDDLWIDGTFLPWDKGFASPALVDALNDRRDLLGRPVKADGKRKRALVPGCGRGYDVLLLASYGYDAWGLESSKTALAEAEKLLKKQSSDYGVNDTGVGSGSSNFVHGDFFEEDWVNQIPDATSSGFDIIYDYTFLCALPPDIRPRWALRMSQLLNPTSGNLICLEFPTYKQPSSGGPPWALYSAVYTQLLPRPGEAPKYKEDGFIVEDNPEPNEDGLLRVAHWKPMRTHKIGEGTDWMSVWRHRDYSE